MSDNNPSAFALSDLAQFRGSAVFFRHPLSGGFIYTEGVQYLAEKGSAYWLINAILCPQAVQSKLRAAEFQVWTLAVRDDRSATLLCDDGDGYCIDSYQISWTDFPLSKVTLWFTNNTLYLPSEH